MSTFFLPLGPNSIPTVVQSPFQDRNYNKSSIFHKTHLGYHHPRPFSSRGSLGVTRLSLGQGPFFPDPDGVAHVVIKDLFGRVEGMLYTIADAAVSVSSSTDTVVDATTNVKQNSDWLSGITNSMEAVLKVLKDGLSTLHVPYAYGFAIILLTVLVKTATFPLTKKQVESTMAMRTLAPQIKAIQERYAGNQEKIQLETARLYKLAGINPLAGCLPTLATIPIWIGLYRALSNVADEGLLTEGFFWIPSLAGPTTIAARQTGSGTSWLFPFVDGHPPLGWSDTLAYLVLPVLLVISQYISVQIMQPTQSNDPNVKSSQAITRFLPLMIGYFSLSVPSGLSLYWLTNNVLSTAQQVWLQKLGGAKVPLKQFTDDTIKKDPPKSETSMLEATTTKKVSNEGEKETSGGYRPGERFKQIKEQEARKRRQREEEQRKAAEAAATGIQQQTGELKEEASSVEREDENEFHDSNSATYSGNSSSFDYRVMNGDTYSEVKEDLRPGGGLGKGETSDVCKEGMSDRHIHGNMDKLEVGSATGNADSKFPGTGIVEDRSE